jgi:hypothetical protein
MVPGANLLFAPTDEAPALEDVNTLLELLTLLNALLLCWVVALPSSVDYDSLQAADERVRTDDTTGRSFIDCMPIDDYQALGMELPSQMYAYTTSVAAGFVSLTTVTLILTVAYLACTISGDPNDAELDMQNWWEWGKYLILILCGGSATGFLWCSQVLLIFVIINYPNDYVAENWDGSCKDIGGFFHTSDYRNSWQVFRVMFNWIYPGLFFATMYISVLYGVVVKKRRARRAFSIDGTDAGELVINAFKNLYDRRPTKEEMIKARCAVETFKDTYDRSPYVGELKDMLRVIAAFYDKHDRDPDPHELKNAMGLCQPFKRLHGRDPTCSEIVDKLKLISEFKEHRSRMGDRTIAGRDLESAEVKAALSPRAGWDKSVFDDPTGSFW